MASRRRRFRPRRREAPAQRSADLPTPHEVSARAASPPVAAARRSRLGITLALLAGYWIGRVAMLMPADALPVLDIAVALLSAVLFAVWYRRRARRYLETRQAAQWRGEASGTSEVVSGSGDAGEDGAAGTR